MWIATKNGFFSIVKKEDAYHVRARVKGDLERLLDAAKRNDDFTGDYPIESWPDADYRYRIRLQEGRDYRTLFQVLGESVDYNNFKDKIADTEHQSEKCDAYSTLWSNLYWVCNVQNYLNDMALEKLTKEDHGSERNQDTLQTY